MSTRLASLIGNVMTSFRKIEANRRNALRSTLGVFVYFAGTGSRRQMVPRPMKASAMSALSKTAQLRAKQRALA